MPERKNGTEVFIYKLANESLIIFGNVLKLSVVNSM